MVGSSAPRMKHEAKNTELLVGLFVIFGLLLLAGLILRFSSIRERLRDRDRYTIVFVDASGISVAAPVRLGGTRIGTVSKAPLLAPDGKVNVEIQVFRDPKNRIPVGSRVTIAKEGLLGDSYVSISRPSDVSEGYYEPGALITGSEAPGLDALQEAAGKISTDVQEVLKDLRVGIKDFNASLAKLNEQILGPENTESLKKSIASLNQSLNKLDTKVLTEENTAHLKATLANLDTTSETLATQSKRIEPLLVRGDAAMTKLGQAADSFKETGTAFKRAADKAGQTFGDVSNGNGLLTALLQDPKLRDDFKALVANLRSRGVLFYKDKSDTPAPAPARRSAPPARSGPR
jgi:phospholipid/cholesterol/gamma-HCH transport system substrate-binding protein